MTQPALQIVIGQARRAAPWLPQLAACSGSRTARFLIALWLLTMISIPLVRWTVGDGLLPWGVTAGVVLQAAAVISLLLRAWGPQRTLRVVLPVLPLAWLIEWLGSTTGWPFGAYHYTPALQPQLGGVPLLIPLAWLMMLPCAWAVAYQITGQSRGRRFGLVSALAFTAWDLFLDPQMVNWGYWVWEQPGGYFGIPWLNFGGWLLSAIGLTWLIRPPAAPASLLVIYLLTWLLQTVGQLFFWQLPGPALVGFGGMGCFVVLSILVHPLLRSQSSRQIEEQSDGTPTR